MQDNPCINRSFLHRRDDAAAYGTTDKYRRRMIIFYAAIKEFDLVYDEY